MIVSCDVRARLFGVDEGEGEREECFLFEVRCVVAGTELREGIMGGGILSTGVFNDREDGEDDEELGIEL